ncbi:PUB domain-containing protein [Cryptosporidium felis]|nr:PUB domain-containing protein [Cryptosporidium felis]
MGSNEVEELIISIGREIGRKDEEMRRYVDVIVNKNWFDRIDLLRGITNEQWESMNIPLRLVTLIRDKIRSEKEPSVADEGTPPGGCASSSRKSDQEEWEFEYLTPENFEITPSLYNSVESLGNIDREKLKNVTEVLFKIIDSIIKEPKKGKIRRIKMKNPKFSSTIGSFPEALNVLKSVGFVQVKLGAGQISASLENLQPEEEYIELPIAYISRLTDCHHLLATFCSNHNLDAPSLVSIDSLPTDGTSNRGSVKLTHFNPYMSSISSTSANSKNDASLKLMKSAIEERRQMEAEIKNVERNMENGIQDPNHSQRLETDFCSKPFVFHSSKVQKLDNMIREINNLHQNQGQSSNEEEFEENDDFPHLDTLEMQRIKDSIIGKAPVFKSRASEYLKSLLKRKIHSHASIRVVFPDKYILQLQFKPSHTTHDLVQTVRECINPNISSMNWFIYQSPPVSKITPDKGLSLLKAGFVPNAQLYFKLELPQNHALKGNYIKAELLNECADQF